MRQLTKLVVTLITMILMMGCSADEESLQVIRTSELESVKISTSEISKFQRIVAIASGSFEIIRSLGYAQNVVGMGITEKSGQFTNLPVVTDGHELNLEKILRVKPDLVLIDSSSANKIELLDKLKSLEIAVHNLEAIYDISKVPSKVMEIASILDVPVAGGQLLATASSSRFDQSELRVVFLYLRGSNSIYLIGGKGSGADSLIASAGAIDVGAEKFDQGFTPLTPEALVAMDPEVFLLMAKGLKSVGGLPGFLKLPGVAQTTAGISEQVIVVEDEVLLSFSVQTYDLVKQLNLRFKEIRD